MASQVVKVDLKVQKKGSIQIKVDPWEVQSEVGDTISWDFTGDIVRGTVERELTNRVWPFTGNIPPIRGTKSRNARTGKRVEHRLSPITIPYRIIVQFKDPTDGHLRTATIDPDMVIN